MSPGGARLEELRQGGKPGLARALTAIEVGPESAPTLDLLDAAWAAPRARVIGLTGPPGVGKSTLAAALVRAWRGQRRTVGVIAIDPSSRRTGGALLGDRTRIDADPADAGVFVRSMAARDRLGGLADLAAAAVVLLRAVFDRVLVETVGVGQSETDIREIVDHVALAVQPGAGDSLQFMKAGIAEIPDLVVVTKADQGGPAIATRRDLEAVLAMQPLPRPALLAVAAQSGDGVPELLTALEALTHAPGPWPAERGRRWVARWVREEFGRRGLQRLDAAMAGLDRGEAVSPFRWMQHLSSGLDAGA